MPKSSRKRAAGPPGRLRIVAGRWRRRLLPVADVEGLRPTSERVRETLFNWLAPCIDGAACLDICAGSGALGFEALSRGARSVRFIESSRLAVAGLREAAASLQAEGAEIIAADAIRWLAEESPQPVDIVFLDPPYRAALLPDLCRLLETRGWLHGNARIYLEQDRAEKPAELPASWQVLKEKTAGNVRYLLLSPGPTETD